MKRNKFIKLVATTPIMAMGIKGLASIGNDFHSEQKMPVLFVGHGNPMNALMDNSFTRGWKEMAMGLQPTAIVCISAHWETIGTKVTMAPKPETIHDFGGFPQELFQVQYPAPGSPEFGSQIIKHVKSTTVLEDHEWGLDHGTWSVVMKMFENADVPVIQLSLDRKMSLKQHYDLAKELSFLRRKGVLIVGSGNIIHNLYKANWHSDEPYQWAMEFDEKVKDLIVRKDHHTLLKGNLINTEAGLAIPTLEHYLPLIYTLGLQENNEEIQFFNEEINMGSIGMRSFVIS